MITNRAPSDEVPVTSSVALPDAHLVGAGAVGQA
jgi:hypothetical protein